jgi:hypothetical protein
MRAPVRLSVAAVILAAAGCGGGEQSPHRASEPARTPDAADINRQEKAPELVHVYKTVGDDPYPWTLTVHTNHTAALTVGGGHGGGNDKVVRLDAALAKRAQRLVAAVPWKRVAGHTVEPGGFGGNDNMARYMLRHGKISTVYAAGDMPPHVARLVRLLDRIIDEDVGTVVASDTHHGTANEAVLAQP